MTTKAKPTTKASKTKPKDIKFFTVVGNSRIGGCIDNGYYPNVFKTKTEAAQLIAKEINDYIDQEELEDVKHVTAKDCMDGYCLSAYNDDDDRLELDIVEHKVPADFFG